MNRALALESEREALEALADPTSPESMQALSAHLPVLEALFHRLSMEAVNARQTTTKVALVRAALQAQGAYIRTAALMSGLNLQLRGNGGLTLENDQWE